jgi:hypothetical protein
MPAVRKHIVFTPISDHDLSSLRIICRRRQRTTEFVSGEVLHAWIAKQAYGADPAESEEQSEQA